MFEQQNWWEDTVENDPKGIQGRHRGHNYWKVNAAGNDVVGSDGGGGPETGSQKYGEEDKVPIHRRVNLDGETRDR